MSNDGTNFTDFGSNFTWGGTDAGSSPYTPATTVEFENETSYTYYKFTGVSGNFNSQSNWQAELVWRLQSATFNTSGSFEGTSITASSSRSSVGAVINYVDNVGTNTLNTDIILEVSADNGSNWTTATLLALPDFSSTTKSAKANNVSVTAGTQIKYKISFANQNSASKVAQIKGVSLQF